MKTALDTLLEALEGDTWTPPLAVLSSSATTRKTTGTTPIVEEAGCWHCQGERQCSCITCLAGWPSDRLTSPCVVCAKVKTSIQ
jgi:hypothetical protein